MKVAVDRFLAGHRKRQFVSTLTTILSGAFTWLVDNKRKFKPVALSLSLLLFSGGLFLSLRASPDILEHVEIGPFLVIVLVTAPAALAISAADFLLLARLAGVRVNFWQAVETTIYTRAANMLPVPGSMAVRMATLKGRGATFKRSGGLMFLFTAIWGGAGFCFSAVWLSVAGVPEFALLFAAIGIAILAACTVVVRRADLELRMVMAAAGLRFTLVALEAFTLMMAVRAIGVDAEYQQTAILVVASFLAGLMQIGIGVREALLAVLAPLAGIDAATGFLAGVAARIGGMTVLAISATIILIAQRGMPKSDVAVVRNGLAMNTKKAGGGE